MRFSSVFVAAVVAALASSISANPIDHSSGDCPIFCSYSDDCVGCLTRKRFFLCIAGVSPSLVFAFTSAPCSFWH
ncbi:hypothetical protein P692DRAFT_201795044 [Suillus brevipes Sb2]|nr:hypothetical protein P692DRAFT_201795044 [Suillus brevipes Sb2]